MKHEIDRAALRERIEKNFHRLNDSYYRLPQVFQPAEYGWPGDIEGRALLAFVSHAAMGGERHPDMDEMVRQMPQRMNAQGYFGPLREEFIHEQQLSGHSWLLRGLCGYYELCGSKEALLLAERVVETLYLPILSDYEQYPLDRGGEPGAVDEAAGVMGHWAQTIGNWQLSSDVGCAFMSLDGLSHFYAVTRRADVLAMLRRMTELFLQIDWVGLGLQTHCTLTAARGMMRLFGLTGESWYRDGAARILAAYRTAGMSRTYQNLNWWGRPDSWTEPCAIVDSLMLSLQLYAATGEEELRRFAARVFQNGFATLQRANGGAGTDRVVLPGQPVLAMRTYEAAFCCTMRLAEGLRCLWEQADLLWYETEEAPQRDADGRYRSGDRLYGELLQPQLPPELEREAVSVDGHRLIPIPQLYRLPDEFGRAMQLQMLF